jgi:DNA helicase-2/ATP-dependent DNA helicase PcrA
MPSRFLKDIPEELITHRNSWEDQEDKFTPITSIYSRLTAKSAEAMRLEIGDRVRHKLFGDGVVISCYTSPDDQEITVAFTTAGIKRLLLSLAPIEKL